MILRSVIFKLLLLVTLAFALTATCILLVAKNRVSRILDENQQEIYTDKIGVILGILERTNNRLEATGLVEAYSADFKQSAINLLKETYYKEPGQKVYPTILDDQGRVVMDMKLREKQPYQPRLDLQWPPAASTTEKGFHTFTRDDNWYIYSIFPQWQWLVLYSIPLKIKYQETHRLLYTLTVIMLGISFAVLLLLSFILARLLRPVSELTEHAREITLGNLERAVTATSDDEFGTLARSFESMRRAITSQIRELAEKEEKLRVTLDSIGDSVIATDTEGRITRINSAASSLTGWLQEDALGREIEQVMNLVRVDEKGSEPENPVRTVLKTFEPATMGREITLSAKDGTHYIIADSAAPICSVRNEFIGVVTVFRDVTRERVMQDQLQHSQRMDAIGQLAGGVAHDFNNMLSGISGAVELLQLTLPDDHNGLKYIDMIKKATERAAGLTRKLLDFSRKGKQISTPVNLHTIIEDAIVILERSIDKRISIRKDFKALQATVIGDPSQLQSGILNICLNARDAMPDGGEIYISTTNIEFDEEYCRIDPQLTPGTFLQISIQDTGTGIPPEIQPHIFEPFYTTKEVGKGTGLGLAAVYGMAKEHHGNIRLYTESGKGTVFHLYLPVSEEIETRIAPKRADIVHGTGTILVVDDEQIIRTTASLLLENMGYTVLLAENGADGVSIYRREAKNIDLVILDMVMPVMSGQEAFEEITSINPDAKVILSSGYARNSNMINMTEKRLAGFLSKPFNQYELSRLIAEALSKADSRTD